MNEQDRTLGLALFLGYVVGAIVTAVAIRGMVKTVPCDCDKAADELEELRRREGGDDA